MPETNARPLTDAESSVLSFMLSLDEPGIEDLRAQMSGLLAFPDCTCGCPSVSFVVAEGAPRSALAAGRGTINSWDEERSLIVFLGEGRLLSLECAYFEEARPEWPAVADLDPPWITH